MTTATRPRLTNKAPVRCINCRSWLGRGKAERFIPADAEFRRWWRYRCWPKCPDAPPQEEGPKRPRDTQRSRLYRAEDTLPHVNDNVLGTLAATQQWLDAVIAAPWFRCRWDLPGGVELGAGRGKNATSWGGRITFGTKARNPVIVLHELAHEVIRRATPGGEELASHGPEFAAVYLFLVERFLGVDTMIRLRQAFRTHRVRYRSEAVPQAERAAARRST